jgi:hypothetical protein
MNLIDIMPVLIILGIFVLVIGFGAFVYTMSENHVKVIAGSTCEELLENIKTENPNYQYDVRAWIGKECWK